MKCKHCGGELQKGAKFCKHCGAPQPERQMRPWPWIVTGVVAAVAVLAAVYLLPRGNDVPQLPEADDSTVTDDALPSLSTDGEDLPAQEEGLPSVSAMARPRLLQSETAGEAVEASVTPYQVAPDLSNVENLDQFYLSDGDKALLAENQFFVKARYQSEFFERYEENRYFQVPNFVTVDSMMHTYHLYFSFLLNRTEREHLSGDLLAMSEALLTASQAQYDALAGTVWESAAMRNVAYFAVAAALQDSQTQVPAYAAPLVEAELQAVMAAGEILQSPLTAQYIDYSQFKPRGYYEGDATLEAYFRAMMWYGQVNFAQQDSDLNRSALLLNLALTGDALTLWERIYMVTAFFAGQSDDLTYYEYRPAIEAAYGGLPDAIALVENTEAFEVYCALLAQMTSPAINSVPVMDGTEDVAETVKGFRLMGQRFTVDAAVMQRLIYSAVKENADGEKRMLPDVLDVPAAMGSEVALDLLRRQGATEFAGYSENMAALQAVLTEAPAESWTVSLYGSWLYTLEPLLTPASSGYPSFMTSVAWQTKSLETFAGSFTELKHDTVLYAKQVMAEMGGGPMEEVDDRGYVEPQAEVYRRFAQLAAQTAQGLSELGYLDAADEENLSRLSELAEKLETISRKELKEQALTDEEYELIRTYGGTLEHFWIEAVKDKSQSPYLDAQEIPASLVTDIATDPNGTVLQVANGRPAEIVVVVPVDGKLRLASGVVYDFYQFENSLSNRLTDTTWRQMIGEWVTADGTYNYGAAVEKPWWTESYWSVS